MTNSFDLMSNDQGNGQIFEVERQDFLMINVGANSRNLPLHLIYINLEFNLFNRFYNVERIVDYN